MAKRPRDEEYEDDDDVRDDEDDRPRRRGGGGVSSIVPYTNPMALIGYYLGFIAIIPALGVIFGPFAIILSIIGFVKSRSHPESKGAVHAIVGILLGLGGLFVCGPLGLFLAWGAFIAK
jgi:hypothetical protein